MPHHGIIVGLSHGSASINGSELDDVVMAVALRKGHPIVRIDGALRILPPGLRHRWPPRAS